MRVWVKGKAGDAYEAMVRARVALRRFREDAWEAFHRLVLGRPIGLSWTGAAGAWPGMSLPRGPSAVAAACFILALLALPTITHALPLATRGDVSVVAAIEHADQRRQGTAIYDRGERFVGAISGRLDSNTEYNPRDDYEVVAFIPFRIYPDWKTLFVEEPPPVYLACLYSLEDSNLGNPILNPFGIDAAGLVRSAASVSRNVVSGRGVRGSGGSTLANMYVQQLVQPKNEGREGASAQNNPESGLGKIVRKVNEWRQVPAMHRYLAADNFRRYGQFAARHLPHVQGVGGERGTVHGVELSAQIVFGHGAAELSAPEQMILAASVYRQILFETARSETGAPVVIRERAQRRWRVIVERASICAGNEALFPDADERRRNLEQLRDMAATPPHPRAHPDIEAIGRARYGANWPERARDPFRRADAFLFNAVRGMRAELQDGFGPRWSRRVARIDTTIDVVEERSFSPEFRTQARGWLADRPDLNPLYRDWASYVPARGAREPENIPEVVLAVADGDGRLVRYYASREDASYFGMVRGRTGVGAYDPSQEGRPLASVAKIGAALVLARAPGGERFASAMARSDSAAISEALRVSDPGRATAEDVRDHLRWTQNSARDLSDRPLDLAVSMSEGQLSAAPRTVHWASATILAALTGDDRPTRAPTLIDAVTFVDLEAGRLSEPFSRLPDAFGQGAMEPDAELDAIAARLARDDNTMSPRALVPVHARARLATLLRAPVCAPGGTLSRLSAWCHRARLIFAKSGTHDVSVSRGAGQATQTIWITGGVQFADGRRYSFVLVIGGHHPSSPLTTAGHRGQDLEAGDAASLVNFVLNDLEQGRGA